MRVSHCIMPELPSVNSVYIIKNTLVNLENADGFTTIPDGKSISTAFDLLDSSQQRRGVQDLGNKNHED